MSAWGTAITLPRTKRQTTSVDHVGGQSPKTSLFLKRMQGGSFVLFDEVRSSSEMSNERVGRLVLGFSSVDISLQGGTAVTFESLQVKGTLHVFEG